VRVCVCARGCVGAWVRGCVHVGVCSPGLIMRLGWQVHCGVEVTELNTNILQHILLRIYNTHKHTNIEREERERERERERTFRVSCN
jgi:hypothetical protein